MFKNHDSDRNSFINPHPCSSNRCGKCVTCLPHALSLSTPSSFISPHRFDNILKKDEINCVEKNNDQISQWNEQQVSIWLLRVDPSGWFQNDLRGYNGSLLKQLYMLKKEAPDYFYRRLETRKSSNQKKPLKEMLEFSKNLEYLFSSQ